MKEAFEKIIERLEKERKIYCEAYETVTWTPDKIAYVNREKALDDAIEIVNQVAEEYKQALNENKQCWIPCSERLPETQEDYIVAIKMKYQFEEEWEYCVDVATYDLSGCGYIDGAWNTFNDWYEGQEIHVIAWQPLPKPYEPKEE